MLIYAHANFDKIDLFGVRVGVIPLHFLNHEYHRVRLVRKSKQRIALHNHIYLVSIRKVEVDRNLEINHQAMGLLSDSKFNELDK